MKKKAPSANDWLAEILKERMPKGSVDEVPPGWMTLKQMSEEAGMPESSIRHRIMALLNAGKLQKKQFRICTGRHTIPVWHYHP